MRYYLYRHIRPDKNEIFYIGIGKVLKEVIENSIDSQYYRRAFSKRNRTKYWKNIVNLNPNYEIEIMLESDDYEFIKEKEKEFIKLYGRKDLNCGTLVNLTNGGEGKHGVILTKNTLLKMSTSAKNNMTESRKIELLNQLNKNHSTKGKFGKFHHRSIKIYQYDSSMNLIKEWDSLMDIKRETKYQISHISQCINEKRNKAHSFIWKKNLI